MAADGAVTLGDLAGAGFSLALPADAYLGVADVTATFAAATAAPEMTNAAFLGDGYQVDTGGPGRLDNGATLTYHYDPAAISEPTLLALGYHDGSEWTYVFATSVDAAASTVTFPLYHFSAYYPAEFKNELEAAKYYAGQMATQKVLERRGGDPKVASRMLARPPGRQTGPGRGCVLQEDVRRHRRRPGNRQGLRR